MQRHKFRVEPVKYEEKMIKHPKKEQKIHTFSDCIYDAPYYSENKVIKVKNPNFDNLKNLI